MDNIWYVYIKKYIKNPKSKTKKEREDLKIPKNPV